MPNKLIISDASPLIALLKIGQEDILRRMYQRVVITDVVRSEIHGVVPTWIHIATDYDQEHFQVLCLDLDEGEASAIALALKHPNSLLILDERKGRFIAKRLNLRITGTLGLLVRAKEAGLISSGRHVLEQLEANGFWLSPKLKMYVLDRMGES